MKRIALVVGIIAVLTVGLVFFVRHRSGNGSVGQPQLETVRFGMLPYGDHTYAIIGVRKQWFQEVGINLDYRTIKVDEAISYLKNGSLDVASVPPGVIFAAYDSNPGIVSFVFGSVFEGYGIMAQPKANVKSYTEFVRSGMSSSDALRSTVRQMRGKIFAYPSEAAIKPFIDLVLTKGGLSNREFKALVLDDPLTVNAMRNGQADFQVGGAPSRVLLEREGFKPILTSNDLALAAKPSPESPELAAIFTDGWATTLDYYKKNHDTILRLASVNFRIIRFMNEHQDEALALQMPYLSQVTGQSFSSADGKVIYNSLDPFFTFEAQKPWYHDPNSTYYYKNLNGSLINNFVSQHIYRKTPPTVEDVIYADDVYLELEALKKESDDRFAQIERDPTRSQDPKFAQAKHYYENYDFLDASRLAQEILTSGKR